MTAPPPIGRLSPSPSTPSRRAIISRRLPASTSCRRAAMRSMPGRRRDRARRAAERSRRCRRRRADHDLSRRQREVVTIAGLGTWPKALDPQLFMREHGGKIPKGVLRTVVPAAPDAWITALRRYGTMSFGEVAAAATRLARDGFPMYPLMAASLKARERMPLAVDGGDLSAQRQACPRPARSFARPISAPRCNTWPTRSRPPRRAAARPGSKRRATRSIAATSPARSSPS